MSRMKGSSRTKRIIAALVIAAVAFGFVFASPLNLEGPLGNARIYDRSFKSVADPSTADEGWIVRTFDNEVLLVNEGIGLNVGSGSLVQILNLTNAPEFYLLDGWIAMKVESSEAQVRTPATLYNAQPGTTLVVTSTAQADNAYVHTGSATATDTITSTKTDVPAGWAVNANATGFLLIAPTSDVLDKATNLPEIAVEAAEEPVEPVVEEVAEEPAVEPVAEPEAEPVVEEVAEEPVEEAAVQETTAQPAEEPMPAVEIKPLEKTLSYAGYEATITAYIGKAYVKYPAFVTSQEIYAAAAAALVAYPADLEGVTIRVVEDGLAEITYPETYGEREFDYAIMLLEKELPYYIASLFAPKAPETPKAPVQPQVQIQESEEPAKVPAAPVEPTVEIVLNPVVEDIEVVVEPQAPEMEETTTVEETETSVQPETEAVVEPVAEPVVQGSQAPVEKKTSSIKLGAKIAVEYGSPFGDMTQYKGLVKNEYFRLGFFTKNVNVAVDPYITLGNFTFGLHIAINTADVKSSFAFDTTNGITGYVSSIAKYIGTINYEGHAVKLAVDRTHEFTFASPVADVFDRDFDTTARLAASFDGRFGIVGITAFIDDLEMTNKLNGKKQFAGLRIALDAGPIEFGISAAADIRNMDILGKQYGAELYPAVDLNVPFSIGNTNIDIVLGGATNVTIGETVDFKALSYLAKLNVKVSHDLYYIGVGAAYNKGDHLNGTVSNSLVTVVTPFNGESVDALLSAGLNWGSVSLDASANVPFALNKENGGLLAYNEVINRRGNPDTITADTIKLKAKLSFGGFVLDGGIMFDGLCGRLAALSKAIINKQDKTDAIRGIQDPDLATCFVGMSYGIGGFEAHVKGSYMAVVNESVNTRALVLSVGGSFAF